MFISFFPLIAEQELRDMCYASVKFSFGEIKMTVSSLVPIENRRTCFDGMSLSTAQRDDVLLFFPISRVRSCL